MILNKNDISFLFLRDRYGATPLVTAMQVKNNAAAEAIVSAAPCAIMQVKLKH